MADTAAAVSALQDAITAFRKACGDDPDCQRIMTCADATEREIEKAYPAQEGRERRGDADEPEAPAKTLRDASVRVREHFRSVRAASPQK